MTTLFAKTALLADGWAENVLITTDDQGSIIGVHTGKEDPGGDAELITGPVLPGMPNLHSHAFQRAMAGLAERASGNKESFWSWRETMYRFLEQIGPAEMSAIAAQLYIEMLKAGYTSVAEFHYVHHQPDGTPYDDRAALSHCVIETARKIGIGITHLPVLYAYGGFGAAKPDVGQKRFLNNPEEILGMISDLRKTYKGDGNVEIGLAHHSLRAVSPEMLSEATNAARGMNSQMPVHIHVAEQVQEVENCIEWCGKRPVEWLLEIADLDEHWCLVHATHMTDKEISDLAKTGAVAGICPTTEANLGDGVFSLPAWLEAEGRFGVGSDSHISISPIEELRWLEYTQRLTYQARTIARSMELPSVGATLYEKALDGGRSALGRNIGKIEEGARADLLVLDENTPVMADKLRDHVLDAMIFAGNVNPVRHVMVGGKWVVRDQKHAQEDAVLDAYRKAVTAM